MSRQREGLTDFLSQHTIDGCQTNNQFIAVSLVFMYGSLCL